MRLSAKAAPHCKGPLKPSDAKPETKQIKESRTDPDAGHRAREDMPMGVVYLDHCTLDGRHAIITGMHVPSANAHGTGFHPGP